MVSHRDLVAADVRHEAVTLDEICSIDVFTVLRGTSLGVCAARMLEFHVGCLPVIEDGRAVRIVTRRDVVDAAATRLEAER